jgi:AcrR family transcriptional regulator
MAVKGRARSTRTAPNGVGEAHKGLMQARNGLASARNGLGPERVVEIQRARLLAAMVEVSGERGAANATVAHVVERARVSRRTFYELFEDREDCFLAAFEDGVGRASRYVLDSYDPKAGWAERIRRALAALLSFLDVERGVGRLLIVGSLGAGTQVLERRQQVLAQIITVIDQGRTQTHTSNDLPPLTAEGITGGVLSVLHARLLTDKPGALLDLTGPLMSMIVTPYLGAAAARRELAQPPLPSLSVMTPVSGIDLLRELGTRLTYRTMRVLLAVATHPLDSNRQLADASEITDQGQISKLLTRLQGLGLIENAGAGHARGGPNAWALTDRGREVESAISQRVTHA